MSSMQLLAVWLVLTAKCCEAVTITKLPLPGAIETPVMIKGTATFLSSVEAARMRRGGLPPPQASDTVRTAYRADGNPSEASHWREPGFYSAPPGGDRRNYINSNEIVDRTYNEDQDYFPIYHTMPDNKRCKGGDCRSGGGFRGPVRFGYDANAPTNIRAAPSSYPSWDSQGDGRRAEWGSRRNPFITSSTGRFQGEGGKRPFQDPDRDTRGRYPGDNSNWETRDVRERPFRNFDSRGGDSSRGFNEGTRWDPQRNKNQDNSERPGGGSVWQGGRGIAHIDRYQGSNSNRDYDVRGQESRESSRFPTNRGPPREANGYRDDNSRRRDEGGFRYPNSGRGQESSSGFPDDFSGGRRWGNGRPSAGYPEEPPRGRRVRDCGNAQDGRPFNDVDCDDSEGVVGFYGRWRRDG